MFISVIKELCQSMAPYWDWHTIKLWAAHKQTLASKNCATRKSNKPSWLLRQSSLSLSIFTPVCLTLLTLPFRFHCLLCCPTCSKNGLFTSALPPISWPEVEEVEEVANPAHLKQPIRAGLRGGTVDHVTLLYWVSVFLISSERSRRFLAKLWPAVSVKIKSSQEFRSRKPKKQQRNLSVYYFKNNSEIKNTTQFFYPQTQAKGVSVTDSTHTVQYSSVQDSYTLLWNNTGHPCWVLSTQVPGHNVLKPQINSACQEYTHTHWQQKHPGKYKRGFRQKGETDLQIREEARKEKRTELHPHVTFFLDYLCILFFEKTFHTTSVSHTYCK